MFGIKRFSKDDYGEVTEWIFNLKFFGDVKLRLKVIEELLDRLGNPHEKLDVIHVGGTNGKGSTVTMISSILEEAGYKVGAFRKPHMSSFTERISINGEQISEERIVDMINEMMPDIEYVAEKYKHPTFFEITAAIMFKYFEEECVDFAVVEVGLGGRLDATNIVDPLVTVITNISLEHTNILGDTIGEIASEKAGIIKDDGVLITASQNDDALDVFRGVCEKRNSKMFVVGGGDVEYDKLESTIDGQLFDVDTFGRDYDSVHLSLLGEHQIVNACAAIAAVESLSFSDIIVPKDAVYNGLKKVKWPGRMEIMQEEPYVVLDGAKDILATGKLKEEIPDLFDYDKMVTVVSISKGKKIEKMMGDFSSMSDYMILTEHGVRGRATPVDELSRFTGNKEFETVDNVKDAVRKGIEVAGEKGLVLVSGSIFTVGEAREIWHKRVDYVWGRELNES